MRIPVTDKQLRRFDAFTSHRPVALIGFIVCVFGFLLMVSPQRQVAPAVACLITGGLLDSVTAAGLLLLWHRERRQEGRGPAA